MASSYDQRLEDALEALHAAAPEPLSFAQLRALGIGSPAQVVYELELAGHPIERNGTDIRLASSETRSK